MTKVTVKPIHKFSVSELNDSWSLDDYKAIIDILGGEFADLENHEIEEYMQMMIADNDLPESAYEVLNFKLGEYLSEGQLRNMANEMEDNKMWEEYPDISFHEEIFKVNQLLYRAYNGKVPKGEAMVIEMKIESNDKDILRVIADKDPDAILRLIMGGCDSHTKLQRLYGGEDYEKYIEDATDILWHLETKRNSNNELEIRVTSSEYWLDAYQDENSYIVDIDMDIYKQEEHV